MIGSLCSGYGGLDLAVAHTWADTVAWHAENDPHASTVLAARYPHTPNHGDLTAINWADIEPVNVLCAGFPCQPISQAGQRKVTDDKRWLWPQIAHAVRVLRPRHVVLENVPGLLTPWRDGTRWAPAPVEEVIGDLAAIGYVGSWRSLRASDIGAPHQRHRVFIVATDTHGTHRRRTGHTVPGDSGPAAPRRGSAEPRGRRRSPPDTDGERLENRPQHDRRPDQPRIETPQRDDTVRLDPVARGRTAGTAPTDTESRRQPDRAVSGRAPRQHVSPVDRTSHRDRPGDTSPRVHDMGRTPPLMAWGQYTDAITRWAHIIGRPAPDPVDTRLRLAPPFVEWMMGLPDGWVTDIDIPRSAQLRILGNGVVPQQAAAALAELTA